MKCSNCNAGLSADQMRGDDCPFCGTALPHQADAIKTGATIKELLRDADGDGVPDILGSREERAETQHAGAHRSGTSSARPVPVLLFLGIVAALVLLMVAFSANDPLGTGLSDLAQLRASCLVDANGDEILDIAAFAPGTTGKGGRLVLLDGRDGRLLWKSERQEGSERLHCLGGGWLLLSFADFRQQLYSASNPDEFSLFQRSDALHSFGLSAGCLALKTDDDTLETYELPSGAASDCQVPELTRRGATAGNHIGPAQTSASKQGGAAQVTLTARKRGTPLLNVSYQDKAGDEWSRDLTYAKTSFSSAVDMSPERVLLWTASPGKRNEVHLVALDRATGDEAFTVPFPQPGSFVLNLFAWNGEHLLISFMSGLWAINPDTGKTVWKKGATGIGGEVRPSEFRDL